MWQAIAEVVKQGMRNLANSGKNAQVNGSTAGGGVGLISPDFKTTDIKSENKNNENSISQTTENTTKVETTKQEEPVESNEAKSSGGIGGLNNLKSLGGGNSSVGSATVTSDETTKQEEPAKSNEVESSSIDEVSNLKSLGGGNSSVGGATVTSDENTKNAKDVSTSTEKGKWKKVNDIRKKIAEGLNKAGTNAQVDGSTASFTPISPTVVSDERLKDIFGEETPIDCFAKIHSYEFKYTPQAQEMMQGKNHVDDKEHLGVMAQELLMNPATSACVIKDTDGFLKVDTAQLTMANTATIAELSRKVQQLEQMLGER